MRTNVSMKYDLGDLLGKALILLFFVGVGLGFAHILTNPAAAAPCPPGTVLEIGYQEADGVHFTGGREVQYCVDRQGNK